MKVRVPTPAHHPCAEYQQLARRLRMDLSKAIDLLRSIHDLQNGPPLIQDEEEWKATMTEIINFLKKHEA